MRIIIDGHKLIDCITRVAKVVGCTLGVYKGIEVSAEIPTCINFTPTSFVVTADATFCKRVKLSNFVRVDKDVVWVTPEIWEQLKIRSNTDWVIL